MKFFIYSFILCAPFMLSGQEQEENTSGDFSLKLVSVEQIEDKVSYKFLPDISGESYTIYARGNRIIDYKMSNDTIVIQEMLPGVLNWIVVEDSEGRRSFKKIENKY